ncbi:hypothetical protein [Botrimarina sp.]|uniref:tetratricopeptide repeat protein n=1 Tax=Botrimarina sp. TaxID=2795802 RepID=UPI0032ED83A2
MSATSGPTETTPPAAGPPAPPGKAGPAATGRVQQLFDRAKKCLERADYAYAHDLLAQCVAEAPGGLVYVQHFRANLAQMHPEAAAARGGLGGLRSFAGGRSAVAKLAAKGDWTEAFSAGCDALRKSPRDTAVLADMAAACRELGHTECQLYYLRWALDLAPQDPEINRRAAAALEAIGQYDQAIGCWTRVQQARPSDEEPAKAIARLSVEKTINHGGYNPELLKGAADVELPSTKRIADAAAPGQKPPAPPSPAPPASDEQLRAAVEAAPDDPAPHLALAERYVAVGRLQDAELLLKRAYKVSGHDVAVLERLEDVHLARLRDRAILAQRRAEAQPSESASATAAERTREANDAEVGVWAARLQRSPDDTRAALEYGLRLKRVGRHRDAVAPLQAARALPKRRAEVELHLGECFQHIEQHPLAMRSYEAAIAACSAADWSDLRKLAFYRAGVLAMGLGKLDVAERYLTDLGSADFGYRDVSERLDKLAHIRKDA